MNRDGVDRRAAAFGLGAALSLPGAPAFGQTAAIEVLAAGVPGDGNDQLARAVAEGLATTKLTPRAIAVDVPRGDAALAEFVDGKRPRANLMVVGLSGVGELLMAGAERRLDGCRPIARMTGEHQPIVVPADSSIKTLRDLMDAIAKDPGALPWAGRAVGGADHQLALQLTMAAGSDPRRVVYQPAETTARVSMQVLTGTAPIATGALSEFLQQIRGGTLRALAIASPERPAGVDIPTLRESGVDLAMLNWRGIVTRDSVGKTLIERFEKALAQLAEGPGWRQLLGQRRWADLYQPPAEFSAFLTEERKRIAGLLRSAGAIG